MGPLGRDLQGYDNTLDGPSKMGLDAPRLPKSIYPVLHPVLSGFAPRNLAHNDVILGFVFQHAWSNWTMPPSQGPAKPRSCLLSSHIFVLWGIYQQVSMNSQLDHTLLSSKPMTPVDRIGVNVGMAIWERVFVLALLTASVMCGSSGQSHACFCRWCDYICSTLCAGKPGRCQTFLLLDSLWHVLRQWALQFYCTSLAPILENEGSAGDGAEQFPAQKYCKL